MSSALALGTVFHRRQWPMEHAFAYRTGWLLLDTREGSSLLDRGWWCGFSRPGLMRYHRADFLAGPTGDRTGQLDAAVRDRVEQATGTRPLGAIQILTNLRMAGHCFNPVSFYFCRDQAGSVQVIVAEITNTPWGDRFAYVLSPVDNRGTTVDHRYSFAKAFHVSPFQPMEQQYSWRFRFSPSRVAIHMVTHQTIEGSERQVFEASLAVALTPATPGRLFRHVVAWPFMAVRILYAIYRQALTLWWKRAPFSTHPAKRLLPESV